MGTQFPSAPFLERWLSGRKRSPAKGVRVKSPSRVRIPPSPPDTRTGPSRARSCIWRRGSVDGPSRVRTEANEVGRQAEERSDDEAPQAPSNPSLSPWNSALGVMTRTPEIHTGRMTVRVLPAGEAVWTNPPGFEPRRRRRRPTQPRYLPDNEVTASDRRRPGESARMSALFSPDRRSSAFRPCKPRSER